MLSPSNKYNKIVIYNRHCYKQIIHIVKATESDSRYLAVKKLKDIPLNKNDILQ